MANRTLAAASDAGLEVTIWFAPAGAALEMRHWLGDHRDLRPQASGDFGARLIAAEQAVARGRGWLAVGADCPRRDAALLREAAGMVGRREIVIGPCEDGGYYLIGGPTPLPQVFSGIPWSTDRVLAETRARLERTGVAWRELPTLRDVDTSDDARAEGLLT
jgi:rSAM/selenodomain-associated transferase 1